MESAESFIAYLMAALMTATAFVFLGELAGTRLPVLRRVFLPGAVLGGALALVLGPQLVALNRYIPLSQTFTEALYQHFKQFPPVFINGVFACLMLGKRIDGLGRIWNRAHRQIVMGHVYAWGQYVVGLALAVLVLGPLLGANDLAGPVIAIGFQGGHGTAAGLSSNFDALGFASGQTIAYAVATFGIVVGAIGGPLLATMLVKRFPVEADRHRPKPNEIGGVERATGPDKEPDDFSPLTGKLTVHLSLIATVIGLGWLLLHGIQLAESYLRSVPKDETFTRYTPLFSVVLLSGFAVQLVLQRYGWDRHFRRSILNLISAFSLDMVIFGALSTLTLELLGEYWATILTLCLGGLLWNLVVFFGLGPRVYPKPWYPYGLGDLGGGTATTASGLLLIRVADPKARTQALQAYSEKQPFYEPFMGGGLITALSLPIVATLGADVALAITAGILALWLGAAAWIMKRRAD